MALLVGWTGGYVLVASLLAPYLRKFGCYTVPDFVGTRYGGNVARLCAVLVLTVASFTYVTAQINATGTIASVALDIPFGIAVYVGLLICVPIILSQIICFIFPGLTLNEKKFILPIIGISFTLFILSVMFSLSLI